MAVSDLKYWWRWRFCFGFRQAAEAGRVWGEVVKGEYQRDISHFWDSLTAEETISRTPWSRYRLRWLDAMLNNWATKRPKQKVAWVKVGKEWSFKVVPANPESLSNLL